VGQLLLNGRMPFLAPTPHGGYLPHCQRKINVTDLRLSRPGIEPGTFAQKASYSKFIYDVRGVENEFVGNGFSQVD
jgi:hypothetical protein